MVAPVVVSTPTESERTRCKLSNTSNKAPPSPSAYEPPKSSSVSNPEW